MTSCDFSQLDIYTTRINLIFSQYFKKTMQGVFSNSKFFRILREQLWWNTIAVYLSANSMFTLSNILLSTAALKLIIHSCLFSISRIF